MANVHSHGDGSHIDFRKRYGFVVNVVDLVNMGFAGLEIEYVFQRVLMSSYKGSIKH